MAEVKAYPMNGGNGLHSYSNNSSFQRGGIGAAKKLIIETIAENLDIEIFSTSNTIKVADLGCSVGPNTFLAVQNIFDAVELKYQFQGHSSAAELPEFQVFFSDHTLNDFNTLITSLPADRKYYAAVVPGSFHFRLFPNASLHFVHTSFALQHLSRVPKEVVDKSSPAWNKGRVYYSNSADEVVKCYAAQFDKDLESFLNARAQEVVCGGLMTIILPGCPNGTPHSQVFLNMTFELLGSCLMDMAKKGIISEGKVDSFNLPMYIASPQEVEVVVQRNGRFHIERMEILPQETPHQHDKFLRAKVMSSTLRAGLEPMIKEGFGDEITDELFDSLLNKLNVSSVFDLGKGATIFVSLKRKPTV